MLFQKTIGDMCSVSQTISPIPNILVFLKSRDKNISKNKAMVGVFQLKYGTWFLILFKTCITIPLPLVYSSITASLLFYAKFRRAFEKTHLGLFKAILQFVALIIE